MNTEKFIHGDIEPALVIPLKCRERFLPLEDPRLVALSSLGIHLAGWSTLTSGYLVGRPDADFHLILFTREGRGELQTRSQRRDLLPGDLLIAPAHSSYQYAVKNNWEIVWFHLCHNKNWEHLSQQEIVVLKTESHDLLALLLSKICRETSGGEAENSVVRNASALTRSILEREVGSQPLTLPIVNIAHRLSDTVNAQLQYPWNVNDLATQSTLSKRHLTRAVRAAFGEGPMQMVFRLRMERAATILMNTNFRVEDVGQMVGYENSFAFSTAFKRCKGKSPREYRRKFKVTD